MVQLLSTKPRKQSDMLFSSMALAALHNIQIEKHNIIFQQKKFVTPTECFDSLAKGPTVLEEKLARNISR